MSNAAIEFLRKHPDVAALAEKLAASGIEAAEEIAVRIVGEKLGLFSAPAAAVIEQVAASAEAAVHAALAPPLFAPPPKPPLPSAVVEAAKFALANPPEQPDARMRSRQAQVNGRILQMADQIDATGKAPGSRNYIFEPIQAE